MKTKKIMAAVLSAVALFGTCFAAGCGGGGGGTSSGGDYGNVVFNERTGEMYLDTMEGKTPIKITYSAGNGEEWMRQWCRYFLESEEGKDYYMLLTVDEQATTSMSSRLEGGSNLDDIYYLLASPWQSYASLDQLENLDELYNTQIPGEEETILGKLTGTWKTYGQAYNQNELHYYIFPSSTPVTGIVYNKTMFDEYGWEVPETVTELQALCEQIVEDTDGKIAPFVYPGRVSGGYWDFIGTNWWLQVTGEEKMNEFMQFESPEVFNSDSIASPSYGKLTMLQLCTELCGAPMPFDYDVDSLELNDFQQSCIDIWKNSITWFEDSRSPLWTGLKVRKFNSGDPYVNLIINYPGTTADSWCAAEYAGVKGAWDDWN